MAHIQKKGKKLFSEHVPPPLNFLFVIKKSGAGVQRQTDMSNPQFADPPTGSHFL